MNAAYGYHISRTNTWEALGLPDPKKVSHLVVCRRCGREFKRARASSLVLHPGAVPLPVRRDAGAEILRFF